MFEIFIVYNLPTDFLRGEIFVEQSKIDRINELAKYDSEDVSDTFDRLYSLQEQGILFASCDEAKLMLEGEYAAENDDEIAEALKAIKSEGKAGVSFIGQSESAEKLAKDIF